MIHDIKNIADVTVAGLAVGAITGYLPTIAVTLTIIWTSIRIGEWIFQKIKAYRAS